MKLHSFYFVLLPVALPPSSAVAQLTSCASVHHAWVDGEHGNDLVAQADDSTKPYQTIQAAIDSLQFALTMAYTSDHDVQGIVYVLPGVYGPGGANTVKDTLPLSMKDRVHVQGLGARRCILRGLQTQQGTPVWWPVTASNGTVTTREVLVSWNSSHSFGVGGLPWAGTTETEEFLDGFTLQGGDVQALVIQPGDEGSRQVRISNCVFDMRNTTGGQEPQASFPGATFGVLQTELWDDQNQVYYMHDVNIIGNTFILGEKKAIASQDVLAISNAVAICDVNDRFGQVGADSTTPLLRGVGRPSIQNNLIRGLDFKGSSSKRTALLGIDASDVKARTSSGSYLATNAFAGSQAVGANGMFSSAVVGSGAFPAIDTEVGSDPGFIGEMLAIKYGLGATVSRDWRLLPDSAMKDSGIRPTLDSTGHVTLEALNGTTYLEPACVDLSSFQWDGEDYGNPRVVGSSVDIGFDEIHMVVVCGDYGNDSCSHNLPAAPLTAHCVTGNARKYLIFPVGFSGVTATVNGSEVTTSGGLPSWSRQPGLLPIPMILPGGVGFGYVSQYNAQYYDSTAPAGPTPWTNAITSQTYNDPMGGSHNFGAALRTDNEGSGPSTYFNLQVRATVLGLNYISNLQCEFR